MKKYYLVYKSLGNLRSNEEVLKKGDFKIIDVSEDILVYERNYKDKKIIIAVNPKNKELSFDIRDDYKIIREFVDNKWISVDSKNNFTILIKFYEYKIYEIII